MSSFPAARLADAYLRFNYFSTLYIVPFGSYMTVVWNLIFKHLTYSLSNSQAQQCFKLARLSTVKPVKICLPTVSRHYGSVYEPEYLDNLKPDIPEYEEINVQIKGYDFAVLESFQKFVHVTAENMSIEVSDGWALPPQTINIKRFIPNSENVDTQYTLSVYERNIQVVDVPTNKLSLLIEVIEDSLPAGVKVSIHKHTDEHEVLKYIPDNELKTLKVQLEDMGGIRKKK